MTSNHSVAPHSCSPFTKGVEQFLPHPYCASLERSTSMDFEKQDELRNTYSLIRRGFLSLRNAIEGLVILKATGDPFFDDNDDARQKLLRVVEQAAIRAAQNELDALVAEYGPDARHVLE